MDPHSSMQLQTHELPIWSKVSGPLGWTLRVSQLVGLAPLKMRPLRTGWLVTVSPTAVLYSKILWFITGFLTMAVWAAYNILSGSDNNILLSILTNGEITLCVYTVTLGIVTLVASFTGRCRMFNVIHCINQIKKINSELNLYCRSSCNEKNKWLIFSLAPFATVFLVFARLVTWYQRYDKNPLKLAYVLLSSFMNMGHLIIEIQFAIIALTAVYVLKKVNKSINNVLCHLKSEAMSPPSPLFKTCYNRYTRNNLNVPVQSINDTLTTVDILETGTSETSQRIQKALHQILLLLASSSDIVAQLDKCHGLTLLSLIISNLVHLVIAASFLVPCFFGVFKTNTLDFKALLHLLRGLYHIICLLIIVEPGQRTQDEVRNTKRLVSQMMQYTDASNKVVVDELELFSIQLLTKQVAYRPLKMFTLNRGIIVVIFSSITTYIGADPRFHF